MFCCFIPAVCIMLVSPSLSSSVFCHSGSATIAFASHYVKDRLLMEFLSQLKVFWKSESDWRVADWAARLPCKNEHTRSKRPCDGVASTTMITFYNQTVATADRQGAFAALRKPVELIWKLKGDCMEEKTRPPPALPFLPPSPPHPRHFRLYSRHMFNY